MRSQIVRLSRPRGLRDYIELTKPKVVALITFTAMVGMFLAQPSMVPWDTLVFGSLGIGLVASAAAAINHLVDRRVDAVMARTMRRPIPTGHVDPYRALLFSFALCTSGLLLLHQFTNTLTAVLTFGSLIGYAVVYTMYLKRATPQNIVIGGAAGAAPPLLGWTAVTGQVDAGALLLFLIIFVWTPPHFWALAIHRREEYATAGIPMLPVTHGVPFTRLQILLYTAMLFAVSLLPFAIGMSGWLYLCGAVLLGGRFLWLVGRLYRTGDDARAMPVFVFSIAYLFALFALLMLDHSVEVWRL